MALKGEAMGWKAHATVLLVRRDGQRELVACCCEASLAAGVRVGMTLAHARALLPCHRSPAAVIGAADAHDPLVLPFDEPANNAALARLAAWATRFTPVVAPDPPDGLLMDITGCQRLYGGDAALVRRVLSAVAALGFTARAAAAPTFGCAWGVARFAPSAWTVVPDDGARAALNPLPIGALRLSPETVAGLREVGVERVDELLAIPRRSLGARFAREALLRIDQALGDAIEFINPVRPKRAVIAERVFTGPTDRAESVELAVRELLDELCADLHRRESGARLVEITLKRSDLPPVSVEAVLSRPTRDAKHLWLLLRPKIERVNLGFGVEAVRVAARRVVPMAHEQMERWTEPAHADDRRSEQELGRLVDTLAARLGPDAVRRIEAVESHLPERAFRTVSMLAERSASRARVTAAARPTILFSPPERIDVVECDLEGLPVVFRWRAALHRATQFLGPERIEPEWWREEAAPTRDYYRVRLFCGRWVWGRRESQSWFMHGEWA